MIKMYYFLKIINKCSWIILLKLPFQIKLIVFYCFKSFIGHSVDSENGLGQFKL